MGLLVLDDLGFGFGFAVMTGFIVDLRRRRFSCLHTCFAIL